MKCFGCLASGKFEFRKRSHNHANENNLEILSINPIECSREKIQIYSLCIISKVRYAVSRSPLGFAFRNFRFLVITKPSELPLPFQSVFSNWCAKCGRSRGENALNTVVRVCLILGCARNLQDKLNNNL